MAFGIVSMLALFPLSFVLWGSPWGFIGPILFFAGFMAIAAAAILDIFNNLSLHGNRANTSHMEGTE
ncbi:hypothetical protein [Parasphingorhabdus halotolerans]|uniref:hypothetical protein n=1 Tax=Parasphingorhabdus halotolerans TaxID=2725558 RepID=UPI001B3A13A9|nr:hypothetical protein [Parasphingorhabdus halotolerans]